MAAYENKAYSAAADDASEAVDGEAATVARDQPVPDEKVPGCGLGSWKPRCLQAFNNSKAFAVCLFTFYLAQGFMINGVNNVNTPIIERRFQMKSSQAGIISSSYDISAAILSIPISYYGAHAHQPRMLTLAAFIMALGAFIMSLPHFATELYDMEQSQTSGCNIGSNNTFFCSTTVSGSKLSRWLAVFIFGMILNGVGGATLYSIGIVFIDTSVRPVYFPLYQGIVLVATMLGPSLGYMFGGYIVQNFYVDIDRVNTSSLDIRPTDPGYIGAWWMGYMISGIILLLVSGLLMWYPRKLPGTDQAMAERENEVYKSSGSEVAVREGFGMKWRDMPAALRLLLTNPIYMCLTLGHAGDTLLLSGIATFITKFIQTEFTLPVGKASIYGGAVMVPGAAIGQLIGGLVCKMARLKVKGMLRLSTVATVTVSCLSFYFLMRSPSPVFAGVNVSYENSTVPLYRVNLSSECNDQCGCTTLSYEPICGLNDVQYFSPCHAGCQKTVINGSLAIVNCSCIDVSTESGIEAEYGVCDVDRTMLMPFLGTLFITIILVMISSVPSISATIRCIPQSQRSFGIGVQWVFVRVLGSIPGPMVMGAIFDYTCQVWQEDCDGRGSCWVYDGKSLSKVLILFFFGVKIVVCTFLITATLLYKAPPGESKDGERHNIESATKETVSDRRNQLTVQHSKMTVPDSQEIAAGRQMTEPDFERTFL